MLAAAMWPELQLQGGGSALGDHTLGGLEGPEPKNGQRASSMGIVEAHLHRQGPSLADRLASLEHPVRVCALKGLVAVLPLTALCAPLSAAQQSSTSSTDHLEHHCSASAALPLQGALGNYNIATAPESALGEGSRAAASGDSRRSFPALDDKFAQQQQPRNEQISGSGAQLQQAKQTEAQWAFLVHGALPFACGAISAASDAHQKFHAVALLTTCLQRVKECLEVRARLCSAACLTALSMPDTQFAFRPPFNMVHVLEEVQGRLPDAAFVISCQPIPLLAAGGFQTVRCHMSSRGTGTG